MYSEDILSLIKTIGGTLLGIFLLIWITLFCVYKYNVEIAQANIIRIIQGNEETGYKEIYKGKQAFVCVESGGMTTTVIIYKKLFPFEIVGRNYSSDDIKILPVE